MCVCVCVPVQVLLAAEPVLPDLLDGEINRLIALTTLVVWTSTQLLFLGTLHTLCIPSFIWSKLHPDALPASTRQDYAF